MYQDEALSEALSEVLNESANEPISESFGESINETLSEIHGVKQASTQHSQPLDYSLRRLKPALSRIVPPLNFAPVERGLFRSGQPATINFPFVKELNLRTILWLAVEDPSDSLLAFADESEITFHHLGLITEGANPWDQLTESSIVAALDIIMKNDSYPLLVCCGMGRHRTGTVIGCLRRLQGWNLASISDEYRRFAGSRGGRVLIELHIEAFDTSAINIDLENAPSWFKPQVK